MLLTTIGAKSGEPRLAPLAYLTVDGKTIIIGSYAGADIHPAWVHNLRAKPWAPVQAGTTGYDVLARELPSAERDEIFPKIVAAASLTTRPRPAASSRSSNCSAFSAPAPE